MMEGSVTAYYNENKALAHNIARKVFRRAAGMGAPMEYDDVFQEVTIIFFRCFDKFDPEKGFKFSTFFTQAVYFEMNRIMEPYQREVKEFKTVRLDAATIEGGRELYDIVPATGHSTLEMMMGNELAHWLKLGISDMGKYIIDLCLETPEWLEKEFRAQTAHAEFARSVGETYRTTHEFRAKYVGNVLVKFGADPVLVKTAIKEIEASANDNFSG